MNRWIIMCGPALVLLWGCSEGTGKDPDTGPPDDSGGDGTPMSVAVPQEGRVFVDLGAAATVAPGDAATSTAWDLAFEGFDVFTNSGPSGPGEGAGFGPLAATELLSDTIPEVPFLMPDKTGGAFLDWYEYDSSIHALWSRYHIYGVRDQDRLWKVQILGYYGEEQGAPVSALYYLRYAEVLEDGIGPTQEIEGIDGTAQGASAPEDAPSECLDLGSGERVALTPGEARASTAWHLCFRRDAVSVNGDLAGPRGVTAVDLDSAMTASETVEAIKAKTPVSEAPRFDATGLAALTDPALAYRGDGVVSAFSDRWIEPGSDPPAPASATWLAVAADGVSSFLVAFERFDGPTDQSPGTVALRVKHVK